ncbi:hypothetical protein SALBM217S_08673 [Streptomyces griseoloalbus]
MGKSALTLGVALANAASGRPTIVHSMEMGKTEVNNRIPRRPAPHGFPPAHACWKAAPPSKTTTGHACCATCPT